MRWSEVRATYPEQWLIIKALEAHSEGNRRLLDRIAVVKVCPDGAAAMQSYRRLRQQYPLREFYFVHTGRESIEIKERRWIGIRRNHHQPAPATARVSQCGDVAMCNLRRCTGAGD